MRAARIAGLLFLTCSFGLPRAGQETSIGRTVLDNGLTVIAQTDTTSAITVVEIVIKGGAAAEPAGRAGMSYLATRLSIEIPDQAVGQDFLIKALRNSMSSRDDEAVIHLEFLTDYAEPILKSFAGLLADPMITSIRVDRLIESMAHQRRIQADEASFQARLAHREAFFGGTGYAGATFGTEESLGRLKTKEIKEFYDLRFDPRNMIIVAVSDLPPESLQSLVARHFGALRARSGNSAGEEPPISAKNPLPETRRIKKDQRQSVVSCAFPLPRIGPEDYVLTFLIENVVGRGPGSRLWALRTEKQLAYVVSCLAFPFRQAGFIECYLETDAVRADAAKDALAEALGEIRDKGITAEEFEAGKAVLWADFLRTNETKANRASTLGLLESIGLKAEFVGDFRRILDSLSLERVNAAIKRLFDPARASWVIVGPEKS